MAFLGATWWISYGYTTYANYKEVVVTQRQGYVSAGRGWISAANEWVNVKVTRRDYDFELMPPPFLARGEEKHSTSPFVEERNFKKAEMWAYSISTKKAWSVFIPHWLLVLLCGVPWVAFLGWRWRRQRNLTESSIA